jgi:general secretion pathway protein G
MLCYDRRHCSSVQGKHMSMAIRSRALSPRPSVLAPSRGFTLIEILVVVVILGILAAIVVPKVMVHPGEARLVRARQDIQAITTALNMYKLDNSNYPSTEQGLDALVSKPGGAPEARNWHKGGYLDKAPKDPWAVPISTCTLAATATSMYSATAPTASPARWRRRGCRQLGVEQGLGTRN